MLTLFAVASPYAWDLVESAKRLGLEARCVDNFGSADDRLPGLVSVTADADRHGEFVVALSSSEHRASAAHAARDGGYLSPGRLVDPSAHIASTTSLSHGVYVNAGVVVASNTVVGCHVNINRSASIGHDNVIGFAASIAPGAILTGGITVGPVAWIGAGAVILPGVTIGRRAVVGAGAVVTKDVADFDVMVGNPARVLRSLPSVEPIDVCPHCE
jgi:sugar O-acyltransferase (sialic acid O-acetyltransferase NeuD family)